MTKDNEKNRYFTALMESATITPRIDSDNWTVIARININKNGHKGKLIFSRDYGIISIAMPRVTLSVPLSDISFKGKSMTFKTFLGRIVVALM